MRPQFLRMGNTVQSPAVAYSYNNNSISEFHDNPFTENIYYIVCPPRINRGVFLGYTTYITLEYIVPRVLYNIFYASTYYNNINIKRKKKPIRILYEIKTTS